MQDAFRQKKVTEECLFANSRFIVETIDEMIHETRKKKVRAKEC